jgi:group I intron endonuclease
MIGIYCIRNKINGKQYVGKSTNIEKRWRVHKNLKSKSCSYIHRALLKYGIDNFDFVVLEQIDSKTPNLKELLNFRESFWIQKLDTIVDHNKGYNLTYGGEGLTILSEITKKKMSISQKKLVHTQEWNTKISENHKGKKVPAISLAKKGVLNPKVSLSQKGVPCPNRSKGQLGRKKNPKTTLHIRATRLIDRQEIIFDNLGDCNLYFTGRKIDSSIRRLIKGYVPVHASRLRDLSQTWEFEITQ